MLHKLARELILFGVGSALAVIGGGLFVNQLVMPVMTRRGMEIEVPYVSGITEPEARKLLLQKNLKLQVEESRWSPSVPYDHIIFQRPGPASMVKGGRTIYVSVSRGDSLYMVPDLTSGMSLREAKLRIEQSGMAVGLVEEVASEAHPGVVVGQHPDSGTVVPRDSEVDLLVSGGLNPRFKIPDFVGMDLGSAVAILDSLGLTVGEILFRNGESFEMILEQSPEVAEDVQVGDTVDLTLGR